MQSSPQVRRGLVEVDGRIAQLGDEVSRDASVRLLPKTPHAGESEQEERPGPVCLSASPPSPHVLLSFSTHQLTPVHLCRQALRALPVQGGWISRVRPAVESVKASYTHLSRQWPADFHARWCCSKKTGSCRPAHSQAMTACQIGQDSVIEKEYHVTVRAAGVNLPFTPSTLALRPCIFLFLLSSAPSITVLPPACSSLCSLHCTFSAQWLHFEFCISLIAMKVLPVICLSALSVFAMAWFWTKSLSRQLKSTSLTRAGYIPMPSLPCVLCSPRGDIAR
eukprot:756461-Hanusia_phi.AAC.12